MEISSKYDGLSVDQLWDIIDERFVNAQVEDTFFDTREIIKRDFKADLPAKGRFYQALFVCCSCSKQNENIDFVEFY